MYYMIERFLKLTNNISQMLLTLNGKDIPEMISGHDIRCLHEICLLLRPFEVLTKELSTDKTVMSSKVIPLILGTRNELEKKIPNVAVAIRLKLKLIEELDYRCRAYEQTSILPICTMLDPRFKDIHFKNPLANSKAQESIVQMMNNDNDIVENETLSTAEPDCSNTDKHCDLWGHHKSLEKKRNDRACNNTPRGELNSYLHYKILKLDLDPLIEWENTKTIFPKLYKLAMKYLVVPGTSVRTI
ncbi:zinc finger BED domain-containing protein 4-like [Sipha flava]|uniref:Zinc finger BED domain-containing protein 4 n=1 Tax=Sipha flava TaxID=143950 RepID=A0A2S2QF19_9HEMI|nr:zinc finger BED domain-containing protein 4-like [Sipha flava]